MANPAPTTAPRRQAQLARHAGQRHQPRAAVRGRLFGLLHRRDEGSRRQAEDHVAGRPGGRRRGRPRPGRARLTASRSRMNVQLPGMDRARRSSCWMRRTRCARTPMPRAATSTCRSSWPDACASRDGLPVLNGQAVSFSVAAMTTTTLLVRRDRLAETRLRTAEDTPLARGQVRVALDLLALTANNITYAAFGEAMDYWRFFPSGEEGWGIVPVWGFGRVVQSSHPGVAIGERLYGYWPLATAPSCSRTLERAGLSRCGAAPRRPHAIYNQYVRCAADPFRAGRPRGAGGAVAAALHHVVADRRLPGRPGLLRRPPRDPVQRLEQDRVRHRAPAGQAPGHRGRRPDLGTATGRSARGWAAMGGSSRTKRSTRFPPASPACMSTSPAMRDVRRGRAYALWRPAAASAARWAAPTSSALGRRTAVAWPAPRPLLCASPGPQAPGATGARPSCSERLLASWREFIATVTAGPQPWLQVQSHEGAGRGAGDL